MSSTLKICYNCDTPLPEAAKYCLNCGQKHTTGRIKLRNLLGDFFAEQFNLDSRIFKTLQAIFIPGKLTEEFFMGKHKTYSSPLRLFLVTAVLFASVLAYQLFQDNDIGSDNLNEMIHENERRSVLKTLDTITLKQKKIFSDKKVASALDSMVVQMRDALDAPSDSIILSKEIQIAGFKLPNISRDDFEKMSPSELGDSYGKEMGFWGKLMLTQGVKSIKQGGNLLQYLFGKTTVALFFMMPFLAFFLKIIYIRGKKFYVEHLIFSFHYHTFLFLLFTGVVLLVPSVGGPLIAIGFLIAFLYLFIALKRIYQQGWFKTLLKIFIIFIIYLFLLVIFMSFTAAIGFLLF